jgi:outer membrane immunogenic protein
LDGVLSGRGYGAGANHEDVVGIPFADEINSSGGLVGGRIGLNWQVARGFVIGVEGEGDWANISNGGLRFTSEGLYHELYSKANWIADVSGRVGFAVDRTLIYGKGGVAWAGLNYDSIVGPVTDSIGQNVNTGWLVGAGIETFLTPNWSLKLEYNHIDFGKSRYHIAHSSYRS